MFIGKTIRELRKERKMTLTELSKRSGVQMATLSRIEHGKMTGTLESHMAIAQALEVDLPRLYGDIIKEERKAEVQTPQSNRDVFVHNEKAAYEILTGKVLSKKMMPVLLRIEAGGQTTPEKNAPGTEKFLFVLEGRIEVRAGEDTYSLAKNNTLYFDGGTEHYFMNPKDKTAKVLCVTTPVSL